MGIRIFMFLMAVSGFILAGILASSLVFLSG